MKKVVITILVVFLVALGVNFVSAEDKAQPEFKMKHAHEDMPKMMQQMGEVMEKMHEAMQKEPVDKGTLKDISDSISEMATCMKEMSQLMKKTKVSRQDLEKMEERIIRINDKFTVRVPVQKDTK
ncbi:MAG: hypothetical protein HQK89_00185 [Nitrospirae bacterium]|nr:hypothetical protein [Nitrospirota bacterium]